MKEKTVTGFKLALEAGFQPQNYSWSSEVVPVGEYEATLDFMIWSKQLVAIDCFFTTVSDSRKIRLTAFRNQSEDYMVGGFAVPYLRLGTRLIVNVVLNNKGVIQNGKVHRSCKAMKYFKCPK